MEGRKVVRAEVWCSNAPGLRLFFHCSPRFRKDGTLAKLIKIVKIAVSTALLATLLVAAVAVVAIVSGAVPYKIYVVHTNSMTPTIPSKSAVVVEDGVYHVGQPVAYRKGTGVVTHRLMSVGPDGTITTKGDANRTADPWHVPLRSIIGGVVAAPHLVGWGIVYMQQTLGWASLLLALACIGLIWSIAKELELKTETAFG